MRTVAAADVASTWEEVELVLPGDVYVRQMLLHHHRTTLASGTRVPTWERRGMVSPGARTPLRRRRPLLLARIRAAHDPS